MKHNSFFRMFTFVCASLIAVQFFSSCQQDEAIDGTNTAISYRTPAPEVPAILQVPAGNVVSYHTYAEGVQVYVCTETSPGVYGWIFREPVATLYGNAGYNGVTGTHYAGPTWESNSGSKVVGTRLQGATVNPDAIPWLLLGAVSSQGPGVFNGTTYIQRVNTVGGKAPSTGANASTVGDEVHVPYTAEYFFYKAE